MLNVVTLRGHLSRPAELRVLPSGLSLVGLELTIRREDAEKAESVPVVWYSAPAWAVDLDVGTDLFVVGHVARRFFRAGGSTQSRTEVVASTAVLARNSRGVENALGRAADAIDAALAARKVKRR
jgi:single-strand DNA-binding protein